MLASQAAAGAGHDGHAAFEIEGHGVFSVSMNQMPRIVPQAPAAPGPVRDRPKRQASS